MLCDFSYCSNVSIHMETKRFTKLFLRGPEGTTWTLFNLQHTQIFVSLHVHTFPDLISYNHMWVRVLLRQLRLHSSVCYSNGKLFLTHNLHLLINQWLISFSLIWTYHLFTQSNNDIELHSMGHRVGPSLTLRSDSAGDVQKKALEYFKATTFTSYNEFRSDESTVQVNLEIKDTPAGKIQI